MECPGCGSYSSSVLSAFHDDKPCPSCGLSAAAAWEILRVRKSRADEALKRQLEQEIAARSAAERKLRSAEYKLGELRRELTGILDAEDPDWLHDGNH